MPDPAAAPDTLPAHRLRRASEPKRVAIIGSGPAGLEAALYSLRLGCKTWVFEREAEAAPDVRKWAHVSMFTPWASNRTPLGELMLAEAARARDQSPRPLPAPSLYPTGGELIDDYLEPLAGMLGGALLLETRVVGVGRSYLFPDERAEDPSQRETRRFRLLTRSPREERIFTADYVVDASGVTHSPRWMGVGGLPALGEMGGRGHVFTHIPDILGRDRIHFLGKRTLLVGDGASAATSAVWLSELLDKDPPASFVWAVKSSDALAVPLVPSDPLSRRDVLLKKANLLAASGHQGVEFLRKTQVEAVQYALATGRFQVTLQVDHVTRRMAFDAVIANVGFRAAPLTFERALRGEEPGFFALGARAFPADAAAIAASHAQIRDAFRTISGDMELDLYAQARRELGA